MIRNKIIPDPQHCLYVDHKILPLQKSWNSVGGNRYCQFIAKKSACGGKS
jgi:hypothetical protein